MSVDDPDPGDDQPQSTRPESRVRTNEPDDHSRPADESRPSLSDGVRRSNATATHVDTPPLTIELCRETGAIRLRRTTALGTVTETVDR